MSIGIHSYILVALQDHARRYNEDFTIISDGLRDFVIEELDYQLTDSELSNLVKLGERSGLLKVIDDPLTKTRLKFFHSKAFVEAKFETAAAIDLAISGDPSDEFDLKILRNYFETDDDWIHEVLESLDEVSSESPSVAYPASDRLVSLDHNNPEVQELFTIIDSAKEAVRGSNNWNEDIADREVISDQLSLGKIAIEKNKVYLSTLRNLLLEPLKKAWAAVAEEKYRTLIKAAFNAIVKLIGLG